MQADTKSKALIFGYGNKCFFFHAVNGFKKNSQIKLCANLIKKEDSSTAFLRVITNLNKLR